MKRKISAAEANQYLEKRQSWIKLLLRSALTGFTRFLVVGAGASVAFVFTEATATDVIICMGVGMFCQIFVEKINF